MAKVDNNNIKMTLCSTSKSSSLRNISVKAFSFILLLLLAFILVGCFKHGVRDEEQFGVMRIATNWDNITDIPGGIIVYIYPLGDLTSDSEATLSDSLSKPIVEYISNKGAEIILPLGSYYAFVYNDYSEDILFRGMDKPATAEVYLESDDMPPFSKSNPRVLYISELEPFYKCQIGTFTLSKELSEYEVLVHPTLKTITLELEIPVIGVQNVAYARGTLSGVASALNLSTGMTDVGKVADLVFDFIIDSKGVSAKIECFGIPTSQDAKSKSNGRVSNILQVAFILRDNSTIIGDHIYDLTGSITNDIAYRGGLIPANVATIKIEDVVFENDGGFNVGVDDWEDVNQDLNVNE